MNAMEKLNAMMKQKDSRIVAGLDPEISQLPPAYQTALKNGILEKNVMMDFCKKYIDAVAGYVAALKINSAFFEREEFFPIYRQISIYAKVQGLFVIGDLKRADIGSTSKAYAKAWLGKEQPFDAITINPYFGTDGVMPFIEVAAENGKGVFVLAKTSNKSSDEIQNLMMFEPKDYIYERVSDLIVNWGKTVSKGEKYSPVGAVVGATHPKEAEALRKRMPNTMFLVPGYGAQGASSKDVTVNFDEEGLGAIVNSSRGLMYAYKKDAYKDIARTDGWEKATEVAAFDAKEDINQALKAKE